MKMPATFCPCCKEALNVSEAIEGDATPVKNDLSICFFCGAKLIFNADISLREITTEEFMLIPEDVVKEYLHTQSMILHRIKFLKSLTHDT